MNTDLDEIVSQLGNLSLSSPPGTDSTTLSIATSKVRTRRQALLEKNGQAIVSPAFSAAALRLNTPPPISQKRNFIDFAGIEDAISLAPRRRGLLTKSKTANFKRRLVFTSDGHYVDETPNYSLVSTEELDLHLDKKLKLGISTEEEMELQERLENAVNVRPTPMVAELITISEGNKLDDSVVILEEPTPMISEEPEIILQPILQTKTRTSIIKGKPKLQKSVTFSENVLVHEIPSGEDRVCTTWKQNFTKSGLARAALWPQEIAMMEDAMILRKSFAKQMSAAETGTTIWPRFSQRILHPPHLQLPHPPFPTPAPVPHFR